MEYGHEKYPNALITQKLTVLKALERLTQRGIEWLTSSGHVSIEMPKHLACTEADALEDEILFPGDFSSSSGSRPLEPIESKLTKFEAGRMKDNVLKQFVERSDFSDDESDDVDWESIQEDADQIDHSKQDSTTGEGQLKPSSH
ncbi:hypothetical protein AYL99_09380 [Fonsecaea erecta]|uniref:Uncharacterized protein n=1 Tax=Fonsecaea erecta TaxID=1367422 RepID=A0A178Z9R6_9EURO|nr:hypothetical protein AYL99_09380 [Fonsecaea erecta]OAP56201.1 hypothetical protein AYL99_09380 [Fonsecaea erecta]